MSYQQEFDAAVNNPEAFWKDKSEALEWFSAPQKILSQDEHGIHHWFADGEMNTSYMALDYHVNNGRAEQNALIYDSPVTDSKKTYTYRELRDEVWESRRTPNGVVDSPTETSLPKTPMSTIRRTTPSRFILIGTFLSDSIRIVTYQYCIGLSLQPDASCMSRAVFKKSFDLPLTRFKIDEYRRRRKAPSKPTDYYRYCQIPSLTPGSPNSYYGTKGSRECGVRSQEEPRELYI